MDKIIILVLAALCRFFVLIILKNCYEFAWNEHLDTVIIQLSASCRMERAQVYIEQISYIYI